MVMQQVMFSPDSSTVTDMICAWVHEPLYVLFALVSPGFPVSSDLSKTSYAVDWLCYMLA